MGPSITIVGYLLLFVGVGVAFVFVNLLVGRLIRASDPHAAKREIYECGEPTIGSSHVQFDIRFYVVALVFLIFDVEVAFLFPWATVLGKSVNLADPRLQVVATADDGTPQLTSDAQMLYRELGVRQPTVPQPAPADRGSASREQAATPAVAADEAIRQGAHQLTWLAVVAGGLFFVVLLVGFAYEWKTGALDWVHAIQRDRERTEEVSGTLARGHP